MALSYVEITSNGNASQTLSFSFDYLSQSDISVYVDGVLKSRPADWDFTTSQTIVFVSHPASGAVIRIERNTPATSRNVDFQDGSVLSEADLDNSANQIFFIAQEASDTANGSVTTDPDGKWNAQNRVIKNVADPVNDQDAVNKRFISTNLPNITTVAGISSDVTTAAGIASDITAVAADATDIGIVSGAITSVNTTATNIAAVNTVAARDADIQTVSARDSDIGVVAARDTDIGTLSTNISHIQTVSTNINDVVTVANDLNEAISEIEVAAADLQASTSNIDVVANDIANVNTVGTNIANVNTLAAVDGDITTLVGRYSFGATTPATAAEGQLWFNTTNDTLNVYNGSSWLQMYGYNSNTINRYVYTITGTPTVVSGADDNANTLSLYAGGTTIITLNGIQLAEADYTLDENNSTITFPSNTIVAGDILEVLVINPTTSNDLTTLVGYKTSAATSASNAASSASSASTSASNAATSASSASTSASNAATSESNAATSASNAATSETNAAASATAAAASASSAAQKWDEDTTNDVLYKGAGYKQRLTGAYSGQTGIIEFNGYTAGIGASPYIRMMDHSGAVTDGNVGASPAPDDMQWIILADDGDNALKFIEGGTAGYYTPQSNDTNWALKINQNKNVEAKLKCTQVHLSSGSFNCTGSATSYPYNATPSAGTYMVHGTIESKGGAANGGDQDQCKIACYVGGSEFAWGDIFRTDSSHITYEDSGAFTCIMDLNGSTSLQIRVFTTDPADPGGGEVNYTAAVYKVGG